jgi:hypothetical protein
VTGGVPSVATWQYEMTLSGGSGGTSDYTDLTNKPSINGHTLSGNQTGADLGLASNSDIPAVDQTYSASSPNAQSGTAVAGAISGKADSADVTAIQQVIPSGASASNKLATASDIPTVNDGQLTIQQNGTNKATFTANQSGNATANIITDTWTETKTVSSNGTVTFSGLNDSYGYKIYYTLPSGDSAYTFSKVTKSGSGTSVTLTYTTDAPSGTVCKLRILK